VVTMAISEHFLHTKPSIGYRFVFMLRESSDFSKESVEKSWGKETANESGSKFIPSDSKESMNVFMRIGFGTTIELVSFEKSQVVTFDRKFISGFENSDCGTRSRSDNMKLMYKSISLIVWNSSISLTMSSIQIKTHHAPGIVHDSEDTLEITETTRKKMNEKMKDRMYVKKKVKIIPPEYSKENYLATFTPKKQLTLEQIFWSDDILKEKAKPLKAKANDPKINHSSDGVSTQYTYKAKVTVLQDQNELFRTENAIIKQHYKKLYDSIKITRAKTVEKTTALLAENYNLKAQIIGKIKCVTMDSVKPKVLALVMYAIDVEPIPPRNRNNREVHLDYLKHLKESVETLREIVEEARIEKPLDNALVNACFYTKRSQELLEYVIGTCSKEFNKRDKKTASKEFNKRDKKTATTPLIRKKQVTFKEPLNYFTKASGSQPRSNTKNNKIMPAKSVNKKKVEDHPRNNKSNLKQTNSADSSISYKRTVINSNSDSLCKTCNQCLISAKHDLCVVKYLNSVNAPPNVKKVLSKVKQVWKATAKIFTNVGYQWKPTGKKCTLGEQCPLTRLTKSKVVPLQKPEHVSSSVIVITEKLSNTSQKPLTRYKRRNTQDKAISTSIPTTAITQATDASVKYTATVRFGNDHFGAIMGYGDYVIGDSVISRVYYMEGLRHNLFSIGKFYDSDLELAFRKHSCYVKNEDGVELLKGSRGSNLYTISVEDMMKSSPICLLSKAFKNKSWLWHRRSKDETPEFVIKFLKQIQVGLNKTVRYIRTDNGTEFVNQVLTEYYENVGIFFTKNLFRELLSRMALSKDRIELLWKLLGQC
ncbi:integrase, catalytic region, zinc finger, CCHC-type containing protein, partial [Tanacetum coccineum]